MSAFVEKQKLLDWLDECIDHERSDPPIDIAVLDTLSAVYDTVSAGFFDWTSEGD